jgi:hypothetical protein
LGPGQVWLPRPTLVVEAVLTLKTVPTSGKHRLPLTSRTLHLGCSVSPRRPRKPTPVGGNCVPSVSAMFTLNSERGPTDGRWNQMK